MAIATITRKVNASGSGSYIGDGGIQTINFRFSPQHVVIYQLDGPDMMIKMDQMPGNDFLHLSSGTLLKKTGVTLLPAGFEVGYSTVVNNRGVTYIWEAWE